MYRMLHCNSWPYLHFQIKVKQKGNCHWIALMQLLWKSGFTCENISVSYKMNRSLTYTINIPTM